MLDATAHWANGANASFATSTVRNGARSLRCNCTTATAYATRAFSGRIHVVRFAVRFVTFPTGSTNCWVFSHRAAAASDGAGVYFSADKLYAASLVGGSTVTASDGISVVTGQWYVVDVKIDTSNNPWTVDFKVDGVAGTQHTKATAAADTATAIFGHDLGGQTRTLDFYYDDHVYSQTSGDYPIGDGYVNHFIPTSDGTHTCTSTNIVKGTTGSPTAGPAITSSTTDAYTYVNGVPLLGGETDNTRLINQQTNETAYVEVKFGPASGISTPTVAPRAVEVISADREAGTQTGNFITRLNDNGTTGDVVNRGTVAGVTSDRYGRAHFATPPTGGSWNAGSSGSGAFNNLKARFGYSSDANPDQYWRGIMIEAEFAPAAAAFKPTPPSMQPILAQ